MTSNAGSKSTITVALPQGASTAATSTTSPKSEHRNTITDGNDTGPYRRKQPQTEQPTAANPPANPSAKEANSRFIIPSPTRLSASRRRSAEDHDTNIPSKKQKTGQNLASETASQSSPIDPYVDPRRQPRKGVASRRDSRTSK